MDNGNKKYCGYQTMFFLGFFYFQIFPFSFFEKKFCKKNMQSNFLAKIGIRCIMLYARFCQILGAVFVKWTFFYFSKMSKMKNCQRI